MPDPPDPPPAADVTGLLQAWSQGNDDALRQLLPFVEWELRQVAGRMRGERPGHTLQPTALVNEAYVRLVGVQRVRWQNRAHFLAVSARMMRRILVDMARAKGYQKRGGRMPMVPLDDIEVAAPAAGTTSWPCTTRWTRWRQKTPARARWWSSASSAASR